MENGYVQLSLPSQCLMYKGVDPAAVGIRSLKGKDERIIAEMTRDNLERKFVSVLKNVLTGVDPTKLTLGDRKHILVWLAINSYGPTFNVEFTCDHCLQTVPSYPVDMSTFEVATLPDELELPKKVTLPSGQVVYLRLLTVADEIVLADREKMQQDIWLARYALSLVDQELSIEQKITLLEDMNAADLATIRAFHEKYDHGPIMEADYRCPKCGGVGRMAVPFRIDMVLPHGSQLKSVYGAAV